MGVTEHPVNALACRASWEAIGIVETVSLERREHVRDRNRFFLHVFIYLLLKTLNCYPLDFQKSLFLLVVAGGAGHRLLRVPFA
jgi:hypothetical protein